jgi:chromosome segregation ATPase
VTLEAELAKASGEKTFAMESAAKQKTILEGEVARQKTALVAEQAKTKDLNAKVVTLEAELAKAKAALSSEQKKSADQAAALKKANDACVEERKKTSTLTAQVKERDAKNLELRKENQALLADNRKLEKRLKRTEFDYNKLSKAKLGRLTLAYWRWKDGVKTTEKNAVQASAGQPQLRRQPLPQESWDHQRENEKRYFSK